MVWILGYFPNGGQDLSSSWLASIGRFIEPVFSPLGLDWRYGVAILASFLAREVFVGTLGTIFGIEAADEDPAPLADQITASGLTVASGAALVVFFTQLHFNAYQPLRYLHVRRSLRVLPWRSWPAISSSRGWLRLGFIS